MQQDQLSGENEYVEEAVVGGAGLGPCQELSPIMVKEIRKTVRALSVPHVTGATHTSRESNARG